MPIYAEIVDRKLNHRGKPRLMTVVGLLPGVVGLGFDGNGTPPKRGQEAGRKRFWRSEVALPLPFPPGVVELPESAYLAIEQIREATKPLPPPIIPPRIRIQEGLVRATYIERLDSGTSGTITPPNSARIILDQWDEEIDAVVSASGNGTPTFEAPRGAGNQVVTTSFDASGNWSLSSRPARYPIHLIYFAETEIGNYIDSSKLLPEA